jgi:CHAT domain-containing protein/Tfp pilus assembly protein PilF
MTQGKHHRLGSAIGWTLNLSICMSVFMNPIAPAQSSDDPNLRTLIERFFSAYQKKDLAGVTELWSERSPELEDARLALQKTFAENDRIWLDSLLLRKLTILGQKAVVRIAVDVSAVDSKTGNPATGFGKQNLTFHFVRESGNWKIGQQVPTSDDLAASLIMAGSDHQVQALLQAEKEFITVELQRALISKGRRAVTQGRYQEAITINQIAQNVAEGLADRKGIALATHGIGLANYLRADYKPAMSYFSTGLKVFEEVNDKVGICGALNSIGMIYQVEGNSQRALDYYERSLKLTQETGEKAEGARVLNNIGNIHQSGGNLPRALDYYDKSLKLAEELADKTLIARVEISIGLVDYLRGNYPRALERFRKALELAEYAADHELTSRALHNIGEIHRLQGDYKQAIDYLSRSLELSERSASKQMKVRTLLNIGLIHQSGGRYPQALDFFHRSLSLAETIDDKRIISIALNNIGNVYMSQGSYADSFRYIQKSLKLARDRNDKLMIGAALGNIGNIYHLEGNYGQALDHFQQSLKIAEEIGDKARIGTALNNIGLNNFVQEDYSEALKYYQKSLKLREELGDKPSIPGILNNIALIHSKQEDYPQALEYFQKSQKLAEQLNDDPQIAIVLNNIGEVHRLQGRYGEAVELANRAAAIATKINVPDYTWPASTVVGRAEHALGHNGQARRALDDAISTIEGLRSQLVGSERAHQQFFEDKILPYHSMVDLLVDQNDPAEAFIYAERSKGRALLDVLQSGRLSVTKSMTQQEQEQERNLSLQLVSLNNLISREKLRRPLDQRRFDELNSQLQKARLDYEHFQVNLYAAHPELKVHRGQIQPISLEQVGELIPDASTALLEFVVTEDKTYLFIFTRQPSPRGSAKRGSSTSPTVPKVYTISIKRKELADRVERLRTRLANKDLGFQNEAIGLYELLLGPARAELRSKTSLIVVPDNVLWEVPFQALQSARRRFLIQDSAISYAPSLTVLSKMTNSRSPARPGDLTLLALGNPAIAKAATDVINSSRLEDTLGPLPEAERQVKMLAKLYGAARSKVYVGAEASEGRIKREGATYRILHLAVHAILNDKNPMYSHLLLSQTDARANEDGLLEAWEIMNLNLKADLVVLAACETARGRIGNGEGIIGLTWASFVAGAPSIVVTQWKVDSSGTTELMLEFHRHLKLKRSKGEALRQAALKLQGTKEYNHPYYWAGFEIVGNGR